MLWCVVSVVVFVLCLFACCCGVCAVFVRYCEAMACFRRGKFNEIEGKSGCF